MSDYPLLDQIHNPQDLRKLNLSELKSLAQQIRQRIIKVMSVNGGHLASNLGSVELTLALHTVFNAPNDRLIFDVSHQTYTHKLITGRNDPRFDLIRKTGGYCGFAHPKESVYDHFFAGHAATALPLALGVAKARDLAGTQEHVIPIIGDATLTCGLTHEALNNIPRNLKKFIVVLNDNAMSISHNVGGITNVLSRLLSNPTTNKFSRELEKLIAKIPLCGNSLAKQGVKIKESVKNLVSSAPFFEHFGLAYIGPINGHDLKKMIALFTALQDFSMPVLVHLYTKKGNGVEEAEKDPISYHGASPFDLSTCKFIPSPCTKPTFPKVFGKKMLEMGEKNPDLVAVTPAMTVGSCLTGFIERFPDRCIDVGIAEGYAVSFAGALAKWKRLKVVCSVYSTFLQRAFDNLFHDVCLQGSPVVFAIDRAGIASGDGPSHHGIYDIGFLKTMPNMVVCQPRNGRLLQELLESAFSWNLPTAIRYPNMKVTDEEEVPLIYRPLGKGEILAEGDDLLIIFLGQMCTQAFELRRLLLEKGISATVLDPIFVKPLDKDLLGKLLLKHQRIVTIEEHSLKGGLGSEVNDFLISHHFGQTEVLNFGIPEIFLDQKGYQDALDETGLSPEKMLARITAHFSFHSTVKRL